MAREITALARSALVAELEQLRSAIHELAGPLTEGEFWTRPTEPGNSMGHLVLHLTGNLNHFVGAQLGKTGYMRDRELEFTLVHHPTREKALAGLDDAVATFKKIVEGLSEEQLLAPHPETRFGPVYQALVHLVSHFALHRGQMSYIARLVKGAPGG